jgi:hypothetical protein
VKLAAWALLAPVLAAQSVTVSGTVTNAITHEPIAGAKVVVFASDIRDLKTDEQGKFRAEGIRGCCTILFDKDGYEAVGSSRLQFHAATDPEPIHVTMLPWPTLRGRVLDPERRPVAEAAVSAVGLSGGQESATTDAAGVFRFAHIRPGEYVLQAVPKDLRPSTDSEIAPTYFPNVTEREEATRVTLQAGTDLAGYEIVLRRVPVFRVSGRVLDERGEPAPGATVESTTARVKAASREDGTFELGRVRPGEAWLRAQLQRGDVAVRGFASVLVTTRDIENFAIHVSPPIVVEGALELDGKPASIDGNAFLESEDGMGVTVRAGFKDGVVRFDRVYAGRYRLKVQPELGWAPKFYVDAVKLGDRDVTLEWIDVAPGMLPFHAVLKSGGGQVRGSVENGDGGIVALVPQDEKLRFPPFVVAAFFSGGVYSIEHVRPGDYYAFALQGNFNLGQMQDPAYAEPRLAGAARVRVEDGSTATLTLLYVKVH